MRICVNADDLGLNARVNDVSFALIARGLVHSASILVNAPGSADAIGQAKQHPDCRFGVHLNVTQFRPLRPSADLAPVLEDDGSFAFNVLWQIPKTRALRRAVYLEWSAQIERCIELGLHPAHLDSHHDVHLIPEFFAVVKRLQWKFGIRRVRRRSNIPPAARKMRRLVRDEVWAASARVSGSETADYVGALNDFRNALELGQWKVGRLAKNPSVELIIHPGNDFDPVFQEETELLEAGWLRHVLEYQHMADGSRASAAGASSDRVAQVSRLSPKQPV
jgi:chitin disaccharide deacetylase